MNAHACEHTLAVVARHLDGDVDEAQPHAIAWQPADFLAEHLRTCALCQRELQRSRRLDAALAESSGRANGGSDDDATRWQRLLDRAVAAAAVPSAPVAAPQVAAARVWSWTARVLTSAALLSLGYLAASWLTPHPPAAPTGTPSLPPRAVVADDPQPGPATPEDPTPSPAQELLHHGIPIASRRGRAPTNEPWSPLAAERPRSRAEAQALALVLSDRHLADRLQLSTGLALWSLGVRTIAADAATAARALQRRCAQALLDAPGNAGLDAWTRAVAALGTGPLLDQVLADGRQRSAVVNWLRGRLPTAAPSRQANLDELAVLTAAVRLGGRDLDGAVRQAMRRSDLHEELAAALRALPYRPGRSALLLDVWSDRVARTDDDDDEALARTLFGGQPPAAASELGDELQRSRHTPRRVRCLLALGALGAGAVRDQLVQHLQSRVLPEAMAAAFALAQLPHAELRPLLEPQRRPLVPTSRAWLLRAALCRAGVDRAGTWLDELDLTPAERDMLGAGCTFRQFPVLAALLRDRGPASY
ncbi:MAG: hypothetical protein AB7O97_13415 [Planctomycetota bacterium]